MKLRGSTSTNSSNSCHSRKNYYNYFTTNMVNIFSPLSYIQSFYEILNLLLSFTYQPGLDGSQCGNGKATSYVPVNSYTANYKDDTDSRAEGCEMSWKLSVPLDAPAWLLNTQLCFNWQPDGDAEQCGGAVE